MLLNLQELKRKGVTTQEFFFEYFAEDQLVNIPETKISLPIRVCGTVTLTGDHSAIVEGEIGFSLLGECTRCLTNTAREFLFGFDEDCGIDEDGYPVVNDKIDLKKIVDDTIIMNAPINFLCKDDCKGLCSGCGANLNDEQCKCK